MSIIDRLYQEEGVELVYTSRDYSSVLGERVGAFNRIIRVEIGEKDDHYEAAKWHEMGHIKHNLGLYEGDSDVSDLTKELAANTWVIDNYRGENKGDVLYWLSEWILSYTNGGYTKSLDRDDLKQTARTLGIYDLIEWVEES